MSIYTCFSFHFILFFVISIDYTGILTTNIYFLLLILKWRFIEQLWCSVRVCAIKNDRASEMWCFFVSFLINVTQDLYHQFNVYFCLNITFNIIVSKTNNQNTRKGLVCHTWNFPFISKFIAAKNTIYLHILSV